MEKYLFIKKYGNGDIIKSVFMDLYNTKQYKNILFIRTPTTGVFIDTIIPNNEDVIRVLYDTNKIKKYNFHKSTIIISDNDFENYILSLNKRFDIILVDPFHEYYHSKRDLFLLSSLLTENGVLLCHDCYPYNKDIAVPRFFLGPWSGETYIAFIEMAYNNPENYFCIINRDTGVGIMSKQKLEGLSNNLDREKQEIILNMHKENNVYKYKYFCDNSKDLINVI
jgi:hypothetical protein